MDGHSAHRDRPKAFEGVLAIFGSVKDVVEDVIG